LISLKNVCDEDDLMIITKNGITIRMHINSLRVMGRATQGVRLINLKGKEEIAAVAKVPMSEDEDEDENAELLEGAEGTEEGEATSEDAETEEGNE
jgi:DNA gyrase subunit A